MLGDRAIDNRINKIHELEAMKKALEEQINALKDEIREDMRSKGEEEYHTSKFTIHYKTVISNTFDSYRFKKDHMELYTSYLKPSVSTRLIIS